MLLQEMNPEQVVFVVLPLGYFVVNINCLFHMYAKVYEVFLNITVLIMQ